MLKEVSLLKPFQTRKYTSERKLAWDEVASNINLLITTGEVKGRGCADRYEILKSNFKRKNNAEIRASGIAPDEPTEAELLLEDLAELEADFELEQLATKEKEKLQKEKEKQDGEEVRNASMESLGETSSRKRKRSKNNDSSDVLEYLSNKRDKELELKEKELELKSRELDIREKELALQKETIQSFFQMQTALIEKLVEKLG